MSVKFYKVGGAVRDSFLGRKSKDLDYAVECSGYAEMRDEIIRRGGKIFLETPEYFTIRAKLPEIGAADFVLARKDGAYSDGRRPDSVTVGTILDDLARRDAQMNAIAIAEDGTIIDPFNGRRDIELRTINSVGVAAERIREDALRMLRYLRFSVTLDFDLSAEIVSCLLDPGMVVLLSNVSEERIKDELGKMFRVNTLRSLEELALFEEIRDFVFGGLTKLWLLPTNKEP